MESPLVDPGRLSRSNVPDENWWERLTSRSPLWSSESATNGGEHVRGPFGESGWDPRVTRRWKCLVGQTRLHLNTTDGNRASATSHAGVSIGADAGADSAGAGSAHGLGTGGCGAGAGRDKGRSSWVLVSSVRESAQALALAPLPDDAGICLAEAEDLLFARDRITCALADRVGRVHGAGQAKQHEHASTRSWLRTAAGMSVAGAGRLLTLAVELARLPRVRERFAAGGLAAGVVEAICMATAQLSDEHAGLAEPILLELAGKAGAVEVAKAGRYLRAVLDPDGEDRDERADYGRRFLRVRPTRGGGLEGEFYLPREAAARLRALLDAYAQPRAEGDDRPLHVRQADAFIALLEQKIAAELLVLVNAESLPTDPATEHSEPTAPQPATPGTAHPADNCPADVNDSGSTDDPGDFEDTDPGTTEAEADAETEADAGSDATAEAAAQGHDLGIIGRRDEEAGGPAEGQDSAPDEAEVTGLDRADQTADIRSPGSEPGAAAVPRPRRAPEGGADGEDASLERADGDADDGDARDGVTDDREVVVHAEATHARHPSTQPAHGGSAPPHAAPPDTTSRPDPPPEDSPGHHTHAGHRPAGDCRHGQATPEDAADGQGVSGRSGEPGWSSGEMPGTPPGTGPETRLGTGQGASPGASPGASLGAVLGTVPGLLLATGQMLPVSSVHRLARTSTLVRLVMDADGQVLDMGRKVRLATPAQRRAVYARYATCWIDGCPLPATMCQIDHADNWSTGGLTDLKLLGPACQFHNRDRYRHPDRYTRHKIGTDRWTFTYHPAHTRLRSPRHGPGP